MEKTLFANYGEPEILFAKSVDVCIKTQSSLKRVIPLFICVEKLFCAQKREVNIKINDENDPFFVYTLNLNEDAFLSLKSSQGILVDFIAFPQRLIELFNLCADEQCKENAKFLLNLTIEESKIRSSNCAHLEVIETNVFKHLSHLSLKLHSLDECVLKNYVLNSFKNLRNEKQKLENSLKYAEIEFNEKFKNGSEILNAKCKEIECLKSDYQRLLNESDLKLKNETEKNRSLHEINLQKDARIENLKEKLIAAENAKISALEKVDYLVREKNDCEQKLNQLQSLADSLKKQLEESKHSLNNATEKCEGECRENAKLVKRCEEMQLESERKEKALKQLNEDLVKANEIIRKMQAETQNVYTKLEMLNKVATKQDEVVNEKENRVKKLEHDLKICLERIVKKEEDIKKLNDELSAVRLSCEESKEQIKTNEKIITWLNKQLSELQSSQAGVSKASDHPKAANVRSKSSSEADVINLPQVNLINSKKEGLTVRGTMPKTNPKYIYEKNPLFVKRMQIL
ncbi:hypothetical protein B4U79_05594 [Dinothrombium tinctorium]|uniref:Spindle assembly abnormal protein 6 N-terminal domain-containing protein n=1 Tax=Dinothrombium tinctorium TaxID=1965070 RepID=A0A3S3PGA4_9ACAR|nr:hypothetical protein B4U79_05594 [Dinothrombium tinctorium]